MERVTESGPAGVTVQWHAGAGDRSVITVAGPLDADRVRAVHVAVAEAVARTERVEVELQGVDEWGQDTVRLLADCARLGPGITFRLRGEMPGSARSG